jgi:signal peptidase I
VEAGKRAASFWGTNIEAMTMAILMALLLKYFIVEAYKIPTGSMQPTLIGDEDARISDRILVDKLVYQLRDPKRWEVVVFRYPLDRSKNFVKRVVGIGPEEIKIDRGDLWRRRDAGEDWQILRRPRSVQEAIWKRLDEQQPESPSWSAAELGTDWSFQGRSIRARGDGSAGWRRERIPIRDHYLDGYPESVRDLIGKRNAHLGTNEVGDVRIDGELSVLAGTRYLIIELAEGQLRHRMRIPGPAAPEQARAEIITISLERGESGLVSRSPSEEPYRLPAGRTLRFSAQNMDDLLELEIDGELVCAVEIDSTRDQRSELLLEVQGEGADFSDLMVYRDIYYTPGIRPIFRVPAGSYFMLGDNIQDSSDGRLWNLARYRLQEGDRERILRGDRRATDLNGGGRPNPVEIRGHEDGPLSGFRDEWGELHWFRSADADALSPIQSPFVPRDMVQGHAIAVFWPLSPLRGIYRLKWVN